MHELQGAIFDLTLIDLGSPYVVVGLLVSRAVFDMASPSGFGLHSPSDMREALAAVYPSPLAGTENAAATSLNYKAPPAREIAERVGG